MPSAATSPATPDERVVTALHQLGGRASRAKLLTRISPYELRTARRNGAVVSGARGIYVLPDLPRSASAAAACRGVLSHESAAEALGLDLLLRPTSVHVSVRRGSSPRPAKGVVVHRRDLDEDEINGDTTSLLRAVIDCCESLPFREALAVADSAARRDPLLPGRFAERAGSLRGRHRPARRKVAEHLDPRSANAFESALRGSLIEHGILGLRFQCSITTRGGVFVVDLADPQRQVVIEADSFAFHGSREALDRDCRRYDELVRLDWRVLRFSWEQVMFCPDWVAEVVGEVLARTGSVAGSRAEVGTHLDRVLIRRIESG